MLASILQVYHTIEIQPYMYLVNEKIPGVYNFDTANDSIFFYKACFP